MTDNLTEALEGIRSRAEAVADNHVGWSEHHDVQASLDDVAPMLAALEAVLEYADDTSVYRGALTDYQTGYQHAVEESRDDIRRAIYKHLGGGDECEANLSRWTSHDHRNHPSPQ